LRILNAQSNRSMPLIAARKAGVLNVQWCKSFVFLKSIFLFSSKKIGF
jgi:hypothetical protein